MNRLFKEIDQFVLSDEFYSKVKECIKHMDKNNLQISLGTIDIDHFNYINDLLGYEIGDTILQKMAEHFSLILKENGFFTRLHADIFAICVLTSDQEEVTSLFTKLTNCNAVIKNILPSSYALTTSAGIQILHKEIKQSISAVIDTTSFARQKAKNTMGNTFCFYDKRLNEELQREENIALSMDSTLEEDQDKPIGLSAFQDVFDGREQVGTLQKLLTVKIEELEGIIQSERKARESLYLSEERYRAIVEQSADVIFDWDFVNDEINFSGKQIEIISNTSICKHPMTNTTLKEKIHPQDKDDFYKWLHSISHDDGSHTIELRCLDVNGNYIWIRCKSTMIYDLQKNPSRIVGVIANINDQKSKLADLTYKAQHDPLTKTLHKEELSHQIQAYLDTSPNAPGAFFMIDIDNFKILNDNLGHQLGDSVLLEFSHKLTEIFPKKSIIGRMGGDEFGAYILNVNEEEAILYAHTLLDTLHKESYGETEEYNVRVSIGISLYPSHAKSFEELYFHSDIALYESKHSGKDCYTVYKENMRCCTLTK